MRLSRLNLTDNGRQGFKYFIFDYMSKNLIVYVEERDGSLGCALFSKKFGAQPSTCRAR